ncbi:polyamine aminopropyltransferase [Roseibacillus ishigakijimensis]|uniref:polyamine aminopropyltransferase n=1 Tax=Roseibacillus ishigakijimensis TaxID=454146 RepID=UPI003631ADE0
MRERRQAWVLGVAIFVMGGCGIAYEYTLSKVSSDLLGNSVQQWALVIAIMLFFMGVGAELQQRLPDRHLVATLAGSQLLLAILGGFGPLFLIQAFAFFPLNFGLVLYGLVSLCGLLIGLEIPLITRLNETYMPVMRKNLGKVLRMDYAGALLGGLFWTFLLIPRLTISQTALVLALLTLGTMLACLWAFRDQTRRPWWWTVATVTVMALALWGLGRSSEWALQAEQALYRDRVVSAKDSPYQHIVLTESRHGNLRCYINGHLQFSENDEYIYHELLTHPAFLLNERKKRVLILGGGDGLAAREVLKHEEVEAITLVDLDPFMTQMAREQKDLVELNGGALRDPRVAVRTVAATGTGERQEVLVPEDARRFLSPELPLPTVEIVHQDASRWVAEAEGPYDVVILDFPDPSSPGLAKLYGLSFYGQLRQLLAPGGVLIQQSTSPWHAREAFACIGRTMAAAGLTALPLHANVPSFGDWGWWLAVREEERTAGELREALLAAHWEEPTRYLTPETLRAALAFAPQQLKVHGRDITTLNDPAIFRHYLQAWENQP